MKESEIEFNLSNSFEEQKMLFTRAVELYTQDKYIEANKILNKLLYNFPKQGIVWGLKGECLEKLGNKNAYICYSKAYRFDAEDFSWWVLYGDLYFFKYRYYSRAIKCYDMALKFMKGAEPEDKINIWMNMGLALFHKRSYQDAIDWFDKVLENDPAKPYIYLRKGIALKKLGQSESAKECFSNELKVLDYLIQIEPGSEHVQEREMVHDHLQKWKDNFNLKKFNRCMRKSWIAVE